MWYLIPFVGLLVVVAMIFGMDWWYAPLVVIVAIGAVAYPTTRAPKDERYPFTWRQFYSREARLRRKHLTMTVAKLKLPQPFYRFLAVTSWVWFFVMMTLAVLVLVDALLYTRYHYSMAFVMPFFFAAIGSGIAYWAAVRMHAWAMRHYPETPKVCVGNGPELPADFTPGTHVDAVSLAIEADSDKKESLPVELIGYGTIKGVSPMVAKLKGVIVARCLVGHDGKALKVSGRFMGMRYIVPWKPEVFLKGDIQNHRHYDWAKLVESQFPGQTNEYTYIVLALDAYDPLTWEAPPDDLAARRELYEAQARIQQLSTRHQDYLQTDRRHESFGGKGRGTNGG